MKEELTVENLTKFIADMGLTVYHSQTVASKAIIDHFHIPQVVGREAVIDAFCVGAREDAMYLDAWTKNGLDHVWGLQLPKPVEPEIVPQVVSVEEIHKTIGDVIDEDRKRGLFSEKGIAVAIHDLQLPNPKDPDSITTMELFRAMGDQRTEISVGKEVALQNVANAIRRSQCLGKVENYLWPNQQDFRRPSWGLNAKEYIEGFKKGLPKPQDTVDQWISVKDRMPEVGNDFYVLWPSIKFGAWDGKHFWNFANDGSGEIISYYGITHWQSLPQPPKGGV